jgi:hypothetical protein
VCYLTLSTLGSSHTHTLMHTLMHTIHSYEAPTAAGYMPGGWHSPADITGYGLPPTGRNDSALSTLAARLHSKRKVRAQVVHCVWIELARVVLQLSNSIPLVTQTQTNKHKHKHTQTQTQTNTNTNEQTFAKYIDGAKYIASHRRCQIHCFTSTGHQRVRCSLIDWATLCHPPPLP